MTQIIKSDIVEVFKSSLIVVKIMVFALMMGPTLFLLVAFFLAAPSGSGEGNPDMAFLYSHFGLLAFAMVLSGILEKTAFKRELSENYLNEILVRVQSAILLKLAPLEAAALFGITIIFQNKSAGFLQDQPFLWTALISYAVLIVNGITLLLRTPEGYADYINEKSDYNIV